MLSVDVVYESEILPRLVLLKQHMQTLQIELVLHERLPATHSPRVVYAPRATNSQLHDAVDNDGESIGLYFFNTPANKNSPLPTDLTVSLPTWPARSSDQAVAEFARYLHSSIAEEQNKASPDSTDSRAVRNIDWTGVRNLVVLIGMVVAATWMIGQIPAEKQSPEAEIETIPIETIPIETTPHALAPPSTLSQSEAPTTAVATPPDAIMPDQPLAQARQDPMPSVESRRAKSCGGSSNEVLRAVLTLQAPTDFTRCLNPRPTEQRLADTN